MITPSKNISALSDQELLRYSVKLAQQEKEIGLEIIACLRETERRMLYCQLGMKSLWEFATLHLGLSSGNAQLKIDAMRLSRDNPIAQKKIESGELSLVNAAKVNSFFRQKKKQGNNYTSEQKAEVIESVLGLSQAKCERALLALAPESIPAEKVRPLTETKTELKIVVDPETMELLEQLKDLLSNKMPHATYADLLKVLAREKVEALQTKQMGTDKAVKTSTSTVEVSSGDSLKVDANCRALVSVDGNSTALEANGPTPRKYISVIDRRWLMRRAQGRCESVSVSGLRCTSRRQLQLDHIVPLARGGKNEISNYRIVCRTCNLFYAKLHMGSLMSRYVPSLS